MPFDVHYASNCIDFITHHSDRMLRLYNCLKQHPSPSDEDVYELENVYEVVTKAISNYYEYLNKTDTHVEDSYLTHWMEKTYLSEHCENIEYFLMS
jgi:hypothetical protein